MIWNDIKNTLPERCGLYQIMTESGHTGKSFWAGDHWQLFYRQNEENEKKDSEKIIINRIKWWRVLEKYQL